MGLRPGPVPSTRYATMSNRSIQSLLGIVCLTLTGCCHHFAPYDCGYRYGGCVDCYGYDCGGIYDYDQPLGRRGHRRGHGHGRGMRQPCPHCGQAMPGGMMGFDGGCYDSCGMGCGCGCGDCFSSCGDCFSGCGDCFSCGGITYSSSCGCGNCSTCQSSQGDWQSSTQYSDCNTGWQNSQSGGTSSQQNQGSQPMAPGAADDYYVPSEPMPMQGEPQPTEASGAQFLMPQQGNAVQPILWAPPSGR
jgi:hypothetical protein